MGFNFASSCTLLFHSAFTLPVKLHLSCRPGALLGHTVQHKRDSLARKPGMKMKMEMGDV